MTWENVALIIGLAATSMIWFPILLFALMVVIAIVAIPIILVVIGINEIHMHFKYKSYQKVIARRKGAE